MIIKVVDMCITPKTTSVSDGFHSHSLPPHDGRSLSHIELRLSSVVDNIITWGKTVSYHDTNIHFRCFLHNRFAWNFRQYYLNVTGILLKYMKSIFNCFLCAICQSFIWYKFVFLSNIHRIQEPVGICRIYFIAWNICRLFTVKFSGFLLFIAIY